MGVTQYCMICEANGKKWDKVKAIVNEQANDVGLWSMPLDRQQTIYEAHLQKALRRLHAEIEGEEWAKEFYK